MHAQLPKTPVPSICAAGKAPVDSVGTHACMHACVRPLARPDLPISEECTARRPQISSWATGFETWGVRTERGVLLKRGVQKEEAGGWARGLIAAHERLGGQAGGGGRSIRARDLLSYD